MHGDGQSEDSKLLITIDELNSHLLPRAPLCPATAGAGQNVPAASAVTSVTNFGIGAPNRHRVDRSDLVWVKLREQG